MKRIAIPLVLLTALLAAPRPGATASAPKLDAYRGLGAWVDIYDKDEYYNPTDTIAALKAHHVRTLYIETANYRAKKDIVFPGKVDDFIDAAHGAGIRIVAWYLPSFNNLQRDLRRSLAAIDRVTQNGERFDSFGLDIEAAVVSDPTLRTQRALQLSADIRTAVGPSYPLSAIIISPRAMRDYPDRWPGFPYRQLTQYYDVFQPMSYFSFRTSGAAGAHRYIADNIEIIRKRTGGRSIPIHVIGGIADETSGPEVRGMVRAARERGILGASLYDFNTSGPEDWREISKMPANPVERPALPLSLPQARALGNVPGGDRTHPKEVFYRTGARSGPATLRFQVWGVQTGEVSLWVNWREVRDVIPSKTTGWGLTRSTRIPASFLHRSGSNVIAFTAAGRYPKWSEWGVRQVSLG